MNWIAVTQRVVVERERRDALDQRWHGFLQAAGWTPLILPNEIGTAKRIIAAVQPRAVLFTGGGNLLSCGGDAPERDNLEHWLLEQAIVTKTPVLGVCRGMQLIQKHFGATLHRVAGHVTAELDIQCDHDLSGNSIGRGLQRRVNSFHEWGVQANDVFDPLFVWAKSTDGIAKAVRHRTLPVWGIMWHPERNSNWDPSDIQLFQELKKQHELQSIDNERIQGAA